MDREKNSKESGTVEADRDETASGNKRRRGEVLEAAILEAAWEEFLETGYNGLTMEGVAERAKTNKAVIYRRWPNKVKLFMAALSRHLPKPDSSIPNTGDLRRDILVMLERIAIPLQTIGAEAIHGIMSDYFEENIPSSILKVLRPATESKFTQMIQEILKNAQLRGEIKSADISIRIIALPFDLLRYELLATHEPLSVKTIEEIVDEIFLPLVRL